MNFDESNVYTVYTILYSKLQFKMGQDFFDIQYLFSINFSSI